MSENRNFDSVYAIKLALIAALEGDTTKKYDSVYEEELEMLRLLEEGGMGALIDDNNTSTGTVWSSSKTSTEINKGQDILLLEEGEICTQKIYDLFRQLWLGQPLKALSKLAAYVYISGHQVVMHPINVNVEYVNYNTYIFGAIIDGELYQAQIKQLTVGSEIEFENKGKIGYPKINDAATGLTTVWSSSKTLEKITELGLKIEIVEELPETGEAKTIYLVPIEEPEPEPEPEPRPNPQYDGANNSNEIEIENVDDNTNTNAYEEYIYINDAWELIGTTKVDLTNYYTKDETDALLYDKQDTLVSGTNIKTINNNSILGSGNIDIQGGGAGVVSLTQAQYDALVDKDPDTIYNITDATPYVMDDYALKTDLDELEESLPTTYNPYNTTTASASGFKFPTWNARGQITGTTNQCYQRTFSINGNSNTLYSTTTAAMRNVWAAENNGNAGQVLLARGGNLSPQWVDFKSDATAYIKESDCSTGTYSTEIATFYSECMEAGKIGPMQLVNDTIHNVHVLNELTTYLNGQDFAVKQGESATLKYGAHTIVIEEDGTITDTDATGVVTAVTAYQILEYNVYNYSESATDLDVISGDVYNVKTQQYTSHSYYLPSSTRLYESFIELWFFTTENGQTWNNLHVKIDATTVTADATSGTFGNTNQGGWDDSGVLPNPQ